MLFFCFFPLQTQFFFHSVNSKILSIVTEGIDASNTSRVSHHGKALKQKFMRAFSRIIDPKSL